MVTLNVSSSSISSRINDYPIYTVIIFQGIDIKLHSADLPLLSPLGRSLSLPVQLGPMEVLIEMSMTRWWFGIKA